jgi:class 3 adenylate cyclase
LSLLAGFVVKPDDHERYHAKFVESVTGESSFDHPHSVLLQPVYARLNDDGAPMVGFIEAIVPWDRYLANLLPAGVKGICAVLKNTCGQQFTYTLQGNMVKYIGEGDQHDHLYNHTEKMIPITVYRHAWTENVDGHCVYSLYIYSSNEFRDSSESDLPLILSVVVAVIFGVMALTFCIYDRFVARRNSKVVNAAARSNAIIHSLFPTQVRERLYAQEKEEAEAKPAADEERDAPKARLKTVMVSGEYMEDQIKQEECDDDFMYKSKPLADLYPETTIMFADIAGFTAWSSVREPSQVFTLLETVYRAFDEIAKKRRVFKVETVGDCYVAVTGLPDPRRDHAIAMARFARDCLFRMRSLTKKLEVTLGPDTGDLAIRVGLHSGPVTAGVLRGERSRFQLFGDAMNTAARMEHTGVRDKIQLSQDTADLLIAAGKDNWVEPREDVVNPKGKGAMQTYWLRLSSSKSYSSSISDQSSNHSSVSDTNNMSGVDITAMMGLYDAKSIRLIEWNVAVLLRLLKQVVSPKEKSFELIVLLPCLAISQPVLPNQNNSTGGEKERSSCCITDAAHAYE